LVVSCCFWTIVGGGEILTGVLVNIKSSGVFHPVDWSIYLHLQGQQPQMKPQRSTKMSVIFHQLTGHNLNTCVRTSFTTEEKTVPGQVTVYDANFTLL